MHPPMQRLTVVRLRQFHCALVVLGAGLCGALNGASEPGLYPAVDTRWQHYQSVNFDLYSHVSDGEARGVLHNLELVRAVFLDRLKTVERTRLDVTVFLFASERELAAYHPDFRAGMA